MKLSVLVLVYKIKQILEKALGIKVLRTSTYNSFLLNRGLVRDLSLLHLTSPAKRLILEKSLRLSQSQLRQDLVALIISDFRKDGYFVEFGATDGKSLSNTYLLEKYFRWSGILSEPAKVWTPLLTSSRDCIIDTRAVFSSSGLEISFSETRDAELSTFSSLITSDNHSKSRMISRKEYKVSTVSLNELLVEHKAPAFIDYLSIDTEGSEFLILNNFDFSAHSFGFITVEHNYRSDRLMIKNLLNANGYVRIWSNISDFDDWYVQPEAVPRHVVYYLGEELEIYA